ncbi:ATP-dependent 6-phosphofructokinase [Oligoflexaceae bacterium]|nr:ATP-dependent 6-phosphofructokinase [Oligoflexaceae bacterium]
MKIGLCTGGGDCPGLNAVIRAVVKHAVGSYGWQVFGIKDSFNGLMSDPLGVRSLELSDVSEILTRGGTILGTTNKGDPFDPKKNKDKSESLDETVIRNYKKLGLDAVIVIGGDGTQTIAAKLAEGGMNIVGIPKTIDNDLMATDKTVGFDTAVEVASEALERLTSTAESHDRIMVLEVMGRDAGYIALHSGIAGGANVILLPEIPYSYEPIVAKIESRKSVGRYFSVVVVAEGAYPAGGGAVYSQTQTSAHKPLNLGGIGQQVAETLHQKTGFDSRYTVLGHIQRGGRPTPYDRVLGSAFGVHAVDMVQKKQFGRLVSYRGGEFVETDYSVVAGKSRPIDLDSPYLKTAEGLGICLGRPLTFDMKTAPE